LIKYLGSKRLLVGDIVRIIESLQQADPSIATVGDLFSGTARVGQALKRAGFRVTANDHNTYAATLARCYVEADRETVLSDATALIREFNAMAGEPGYFTRTFCEESRFFQAKNGARVDAIREAIGGLKLDPQLEAVVLVALMEAADRVDSTTGVQMAYLKAWAPRSFQDLELRMPDVLSQAPSGPGHALELDALDALRAMDVDVLYLDPPYNQHKYLGNYHIWETLVRWDKPEAYGIARKRVDCRERRSDFNSKKSIVTAMERIIAEAKCRAMVVSFSNEGYLSREVLEAILTKRGHVTVLSYAYKRYVGAQIGVFNPRGEKVGKTSHTGNVENIYVVTPEPWSPPVA